MSDIQIQATASSFFSPFLCFPLSHRLSRCFHPLFLCLFPEPHLGLKSSISKEWRGSLPQLGVKTDSEEHIIDRLLLWVTLKTFLHVHLLYRTNMMKNSRDSWNAGFLSSPTTLAKSNSKQLFDWKVYLLTTLAEDLGNPRTAVMTTWQKLTRLWWFSLKGWLSYMKILPLSWRKTFAFLMCWSSQYVRIARQFVFCLTYVICVQHNKQPLSSYCTYWLDEEWVQMSLYDWLCGILS